MRNFIVGVNDMKYSSRPTHFLSSGNLPGTHTHTHTENTVNLWELRRRERPTATETITFETAKFNYSLSSL